jgi:hypothetical protein
MSLTTNYDSVVNSFYLAYYGRPADPAGLAFWSAQLERVGGDLGAINEAFATSEEATAHFGSEDVTARITDIYQQLFDRAPEAAGLKFWTDAIQEGKLSLADAAIEIMRSAQGTDNELSHLRLQAADQFTAAVTAAGLDYQGDAAIAAARVLVEAVKLSSSAEHIAAMAASAAQLAHVATHTPAVIEAIGVGVHLSDLFDTARGTAEPVQLMQALADTAKAAAGDPATLESLLRGGGMAKVLQVMPGDATLKDVVDALKAGGLPAAVEVVYPSAHEPSPDPIPTPAPDPVPTPDPVPAPEPTLAFAKVTEGLADLHHDNVTKVASVAVDFSYTGNAPADGQQFQVSLDGENWTSEGVNLSADGKTVTVAGLDVSTGTPDPAFVAPSAEATANLPAAFIPQPNLLTTVHLRLADANGKAVLSTSQDIVYDGHVVVPNYTLVNDTAGGFIGTHDDMTTKDGSFELSGIEDGAKVDYLLDLELSGADFATWTTTRPELREGENSFFVRQTDAAGNVSGMRHVDFILDTKAPSAPIPALQQDTGIKADDGITSNGKVELSGLDTDIDTAWSYSIDNGADWTYGGRNNGTGKAELDLATLNKASGTLLVAQYDKAGNASDIARLDFTLDKTAPTGVLAFAGITGENAGAASTTLDKADVNFSFSGDSGDGIVEWRLQGGDGKWIALGQDAYNSDGSVTIKGLDLSQADPTIELHVINAAGNQGMTLTQAIDGPFGVSPHFSLTPGADGIQFTSNVAGKIWMSGPDRDFNLVSTDASLGAIDGTTTVGAQAVVSTGAFLLTPTGGTAISSLDQNYYTLGTNADDLSLTGANLWGFGGNDTLTGTAGKDMLYGGDGDDLLLGGGGDDLLAGGEGSNKISGGSGADTIDLTLGANKLTYGSASASTVTGGAGAAGGFDTAIFAGANTVNYDDQSFQFSGAVSMSNWFKVNAAASPADGSGDALLLALNNAFQPMAAPTSSAQLMLVGFDNQDHYLVYESGNGMVDNNDTVIKLVGQIPDGISVDWNTKTVTFTYAAD